MYYFHFLGYIQIYWLDIVEQTRTGMQVLIPLQPFSILYIKIKNGSFCLFRLFTGDSHSN